MLHFFISVTNEPVTMLKSVKRPMTMPFNTFKQHTVTPYGLKNMDFFVKSDGFHLVAINDPYGAVQYYTKWGTPLETGTTHPSLKHPSIGRTLRAINTHLHGLPDEDRVDPLRIERSDLQRDQSARQVNFEFVVYRKNLLAAASEEWEEGKAESLQDLFHGKCVNADETLNTVNYEYRIKIFDVSFTSNIPVFARVEAAAGYYGLDNVATQIFGFGDLIKYLNGCEGVVAHEGGPGKKECFKIKIPCPVRARILGVQNTIDEFAGWNKILIGVENTANQSFSAISEIDLTDILTDYTRPSKGKVYANSKCVKYSPVAGTVVYELSNGAQSTSAIAPTLNALYGLIGRATRFHPVTLTTTMATIRTVGDNHTTVTRSGNRSFKLAGYEFLTNPPDIIMGVNDIWEIDHNQIHLQASNILCLPAAGFGPAEFMDMPRTDENTLHIAATQRLCRDRTGYYKLVGMTSGPFDGLVPMDHKRFCAGI